MRKTLLLWRCIDLEVVQLSCQERFSGLVSLILGQIVITSFPCKLSDVSYLTIYGKSITYFKRRKCIRLSCDRQ